MQADAACTQSSEKTLTTPRSSIAVGSNWQAVRDSVLAPILPAVPTDGLFAFALCTAMLFVQKEEYEWPGPGNKPRFNPAHPVTKLEGDRDVFGDGSVTVIRTLGHTPGHQSLLVRLPKTGAVLLSGDAVHSAENWEHRYVPEQNTSKEQTLASMQHMADLIAKEKAQLWINHDAPQASQKRHSPEFYE